MDAQTDALKEHPLSDVLNWLMHRAALSMGEAESRACREQGLSIRGYVTLRYIAKSEPQTQLEIAREICLDKTTTTAVIDELVASGFVVREIGSKDRRSRVPAITDAGLAVIAGIAPTIQSIENDALASLAADERTEFVSSLRKIAFSPFAMETPPSGSCM